MFEWRELQSVVESRQMYFHLKNDSRANIINSFEMIKGRRFNDFDWSSKESGKSQENHERFERR